MQNQVSFIETLKHKKFQLFTEKKVQSLGIKIIGHTSYMLKSVKQGKCSLIQLQQPNNLHCNAISELVRLKCNMACNRQDWQDVSDYS